MFDLMNYFDSKEIMVVYLQIVFEENDFDFLMVVFNDVICVQGVVEVVGKVGLGCESFYKIFKLGVEFRLGIVFCLFGVFDLCLSIVVF